MSKPNRVAAYLPKRPYEPVGSTRKQREAEAAVENLKDAGFDAKCTSMRVGPRKGGWTVYNVWKRTRI